ncbi:unnamed protein product [Polarella glacialis]|uniref:CSD domain-containing protein n=1 Tax=Polarella glacialis TaxID=89957 RepID=A0A813GFC8_POLGL|nr:unnamed protein product [Polarella glacialis]
MLRAVVGRGLFRPLALRPLQAPFVAPSSVRAFGDKAGQVKFFNPERGFGFISSEGQEYFVHYTGIEASTGFKSLADGEDVEFDLEQDHAGKMRCVRVTGPGGVPVKGSAREREGQGTNY